MFFVNLCSSKCIFFLFPLMNHSRQPNSVVRPIDELISEFWLESRSDGLVDCVCFRLIDIAAQKVLRVSCSEVSLTGMSSPTQYEYVTGLKSMVGYCFRLIDIRTQMMVLQGSHQAKVDTG